MDDPVSEGVDGELWDAEEVLAGEVALLLLVRRREPQPQPLVGVEEGVAGGAHRLREGGPVVAVEDVARRAVADVAHRSVGGQESGVHLVQNTNYSKTSSIKLSVFKKRVN